MKRVLIVDDAIDLGRLFQDALKTAHPGMPITVVPSAEEALLESTRLTIDLLVTDIRLPGMSGIELVRKIRVRQPQVKIFMITGIKLDDRTQKQLDELQVDVFRRKPLGIGDFLDACDELLGFKPAPIAAEPASPVTPTTAARDDELRSALEAALPGKPVAPQEKRPAGAARPQPEEEPAPTGLAVQLSHLRSSLGALAALLLDERGHVVAQAGDLPDPALLESLVAPLGAALSAAARVSYVLGQPHSAVVQAYQGQSLHLVVAPVGQFGLLIAQRAGVSTLRMALAFEETLNAQPELAQTLEKMGLHVQKAAEVSPPESVLADLGLIAAVNPVQGQAQQPPEAGLNQDAGLEQLEALIDKQSSGEIKLADVDSFWESAAASEKSKTAPPGVINYEQAQKLGLLPGEDS